MNKLSIFFALGIIIFLLLKPQTGSAYENDGLWAALPNLKIGAPVPQDGTAADYVILVSPSQFLPASEWSYDGVEYTLGVDKSGTIQHISTNSGRVKTPSGVYVGMSLSELQNTVDVKLLRIPGWAWTAGLPSGWRAGFSCGRGITDCELSPNDKVVFIYK